MQQQIAYILVLDWEGFFNGGSQSFHHLRVLKVVHDVLQDVLVGHKAERSEEDQDGDVGADVGDVDHDGLPQASRPPGTPGQHLDGHAAAVPTTVFHHRPAQRHV